MAEEEKLRPRLSANFDPPKPGQEVTAYILEAILPAIPVETHPLVIAYAFTQTVVRVAKIGLHQDGDPQKIAKVIQQHSLETKHAEFLELRSKHETRTTDTQEHEDLVVLYGLLGNLVLSREAIQLGREQLTAARDTLVTKNKQYQTHHIAYAKSEVKKDLLLQAVRFLRRQTINQNAQGYAENVPLPYTEIIGELNAVIANGELRSPGIVQRLMILSFMLDQALEMSGVPLLRNAINIAVDNYYGLPKKQKNLPGN